LFDFILGDDLQEEEDEDDEENVARGFLGTGAQVQPNVYIIEEDVEEDFYAEEEMEEDGGEEEEMEEDGGEEEEEEEDEVQEAIRQIRKHILEPEE